MDIPTVAQMMEAYAEDAVDFARNAFGVSLDYSEESLRRVEEILDRLYKDRPRGLMRLFRRNVSDEKVQQVAKMLGAYVGEVMRRRFAGRWTMETEAFPGQQMVTLRIGQTDCWPGAKVYKRLTNGPEDNIVYYCHVITSSAGGEQE